MVQTSFSFRIVNKTTGELILDTLDKPRHTTSFVRLRELFESVFKVLSNAAVNYDRDSLEIVGRVNREVMEEKIVFSDVY